MTGRAEERKIRVASDMAELQLEVEDLRRLVNTLLTVIMEEADGIHSGAAPTPPGGTRPGISM